MNGDWLPSNTDALALWFQNFVDHSQEITKETGIPDAQVQVVSDLATAWLAAHAEVARLRSALAAAVLSQTAAQAAANAPLRALVRQIKASPKATPALLALLHILPATDTAITHVDAEKPVLTLAQGPGRVEISFVKHGRSGIRLYCKRGSETAFSEVSTYTSSPALDRRANLLPGQAEHREYYAWYVSHDESIGSQGDTASIAVAPTPA